MTDFGLILFGMILGVVGLAHFESPDSNQPTDVNMSISTSLARQLARKKELVPPHNTTKEPHDTISEPQEADHNNAFERDISEPNDSSESAV